MTSSEGFVKYMAPGARGHLVGIGGVSMSPLAEVLARRGLVISGSDMRESETTRHLAELGIDVKIGHAPENIDGAEFIVRTAAARDDNVEIAEARRRGIPVFERAEAWGAIMREYKNAICISGTHGKTTTTSMVTHILMAAQKDPTVMIGGTLPLLHSCYRVGHGETIVLESCEYYNSFHSFFPTVAVVLNVDEDHLDFFKDIEDIKRSFRKFCEMTPPDGTVVYNADDANTVSALAGIDRRTITFGLKETADVRAVDIELGRETSFTVVCKGVEFCRLKLRLTGLHNVKNALAAIAVAICGHIPGSAVVEGLTAFSGADRRLQFKGKINGADIYDDYAHNPGELDALFAAVAQMGYKRVVCAFQPHTYSRTKLLMEDFVKQLSKPDVLVLAEIYAARETNTFGISSRDLQARLPGSEYCADLGELEAKLREIASPGDIVLTVGAGDVYRVGEKLAE
ncbi:MAG: UDP-N-acetylmuramate--L-alanine ligase [Oscillospiraceae bacterium]|nr:UDP-N-acetylmuramate--L-alanine ligase [Oscillospiraceae bacterium]